MSIASLVVAIAYLLVVIVGAVGALLLLVWLFRETPGEARTRRKTTKSARNAKFGKESTPSAPAEIEPPKDRAA